MSKESAELDRAIATVIAIWVVLFLVGFLGCYRGPAPEPVRVGDPQVRVVSEIIFPVKADWWRQAPWFDLHNDMGTPTRVLLSGVWACVQYSIGTDEPKVGFAYRCRQYWRSGPHDIRKTPG